MRTKIALTDFVNLQLSTRYIGAFLGKYRDNTNFQVFAIALTPNPSPKLGEGLLT
ncbi:hypothetical protein [Hydrococcus rivularis]|uniref:hypothetical protein n=1 Tax=Hydrococcus rivularis TaxID=1616834 RepID=UPI000B0219CA|nr:hypothetical protein [Hydrococcus rivularis]